jgi:hypothetical protein
MICCRRCLCVPSCFIYLLAAYPFRFHKECLSGEKGTYIENRAFVEGKISHEALAELEPELCHSRDTTFVTLDNPMAAKVRNRIRVE